VRHFVIVYERDEQRLLELHTFRKPQMAETYSRTLAHLNRANFGIHVEVLPADDVTTLIERWPAFFEVGKR
jgi:hypothetical protein